MEVFSSPTSLLVGLRSAIYLDGIRGMIDSGRWEKLPPDSRLPAFDHIFCARGGAGCYAVGRIWSSRDGKGRARYPLILALEAPRPLLWALDHLLPVLEEAKAELLRMEAATAVADCLRGVQARLDALLGPPESAHALPTWLDLDREASLAEAFVRVLYRFERECSPFLRGAPAGAAGSRCIRLPRMAPAEGPALGLAAAVAALMLRDDVPRTFLCPLRGTWVDAIMGTARTEDYFCMMSTTANLPATSDIPYQIDEATRGRLQERLQALARAPEVSREVALRPGVTGATDWPTRMLGKVMGLLRGNA